MSSADQTVPEFRIVAVRHAEVGGHTHITDVKLADGSTERATRLIAAINDHEAHYTMIPPEGTPAYQAWQESGLPLLVQTRQCPDCNEEVLFA